MRLSHNFQKWFSAGMCFLLMGIGVIPSSGGIQAGSPNERVCTINTSQELSKEVVVTSYLFNNQGRCIQQQQRMSVENAEILLSKITQLEYENAIDPLSDRTYQLQQVIISKAKEYHLLPSEYFCNVRDSSFLSLLSPFTHRKATRSLQPERATEWLCTFISIGSGTSLPIIILPRLIPILLTPIPRVFVRWNTDDGLTSCGGLNSGTGYIAYGQQKGVALGFWGLGFTFSLPPIMGRYGLIGYALLSTVTADTIELYPLNNPPEVSSVYPLNGATNIPLSIQNLSFHLADPDGDLMSYQVITIPDIGSEEGTLKEDGTYSIPIHGIQSSTEYVWEVVVTDGKDATEKKFTFTTVIEAPVVSDPYPRDQAKYIPIGITNLSFNIVDYQEEAIDWTVETAPPIGSGSASGVGNGRYTIPISNLTYFTNYTWFVNATDGEYWMRKQYTFTTTAEGVLGFEPTDDTTIHHNAPDVNDGTDKMVTVRNEYGASSGWERDVLLRCDVSLIPPNVSIRYAYLQMFYADWHDNNPAGRSLNLYKATSSWDEETVTWNTKPTYADQPTTTAMVPQTTGVWMEWDVTSDIQAFSDGSIANYGWKITDENYWGHPDIPIVYYHSKENSECLPILLIGYDE